MVSGQPTNIPSGKHSSMWGISQLLQSPWLDLPFTIPSPVTLSYTVNGRSEESWPSSPRTHCHIHIVYPPNPFPAPNRSAPLVSPHFTSPYPSLVNPFTHNAFSGIIASLFGDEVMSNIVFIISSTQLSDLFPRRRVGRGRRWCTISLLLDVCPTTLHAHFTCLMRLVAGSII